MKIKEEIIKSVKEERDGFLNLFKKESNTINVSKVNRVEIIGEGREFVRYFDSGEFQLQDEGRTLKIFVDSPRNY